MKPGTQWKVAPSRDWFVILGVSNFSVVKLQAVLDDCSIKPAVNQVEMHPLLCQLRLKRYCDQNGVSACAYSPLGSRDRDGAYMPKDEPDLFELEVIKSPGAYSQLYPGADTAGLGN